VHVYTSADRDAVSMVTERLSCERASEAATTQGVNQSSARHAADVVRDDNNCDELRKKTRYR